MNKFNQGTERPNLKNYKTLIKEIRDDSKNGKIHHALRLEELILLK